MKNVNGIDTPFDTAIFSPPSPSGGVGTKDVGGVTIPDGQKGTTGEMPEVNGVTLPNDKAPGRSRPDMAGS